MKKPIIIERKQLDHVLEHDKILYNTNNHYSDENVPQPSDYKSNLLRTTTKNWVDKFHKHYHKITLDPSEMRWLKEASKIGMLTGKFSHIYDDNLDALCEKYVHLFPTEGLWFVRTERVSLKEGMHGAGPYTDFRSMIESAVSSGQGHQAFDEEIQPVFYLFPWLEINPDKEFRIFVCNNEITAISVQHLYSINHWLNTMGDDEIKNMIYNILQYFEQNIKDKLTFLGSYTMDLALIGPDDIPYFIEPNSFGKYYAAGSALYHWIYDHDHLYDSSEITFRYCNEY